MNYPTHERSASEHSGYRYLCAEVERAAGIVKLDHSTAGWAIEVILRPTPQMPAHRAAAVLFADIDELDTQAWHLLTWVAFNTTTSRRS